jgi:hypothetical protein
MNRRTFLGTLTAAGFGEVLCWPGRTPAESFTLEPPNANGVQLSEAGIDPARVDAIGAEVGRQREPNWCWAACVAYVCRYHGCFLSQEEVVGSLYGGLQNRPASQQAILASLHRRGVDVGGIPFEMDSNVFSANYETAAADLTDNRPLVLGTMKHLMVLVCLRFLHTPGQFVGVKEAFAWDPAIGRKRELQAPEWSNVDFLARIVARHRVGVRP